MPPKSQRADKTRSIEAAADNFKKAVWHFAPLSVTDKVEEEYAVYLRDLRTRNHRKKLPPEESQYVRSRWLRSQAMMRNFDEFNRLIDSCDRFVEELTKIGKQSILGTRAALKKATTHERPSPKIEFQPEFTPHHPPLSNFEYETLVGGPHVLGARLLWWCAAATNPQKYGYSAGFSHQLWTEPLWFTEKVENNWLKLTANQRTLTLLQQAVEFCFQYKDCSESEVPPEDGPGVAGDFYWKGIHVELTRQEFKLIKALWKQQNKYRDIQYIIDEAWEEAPNTTKATVQSCASKLSKKLADVGIPISISFRDLTVIITSDLAD